MDRSEFSGIHWFYGPLINKTRLHSSVPLVAVGRGGECMRVVSAGTGALLFQALDLHFVGLLSLTNESKSCLMVIALTFAFRTFE